MTPELLYRKARQLEDTLAVIADNRHDLKHDGQYSAIVERLNVAYEQIRRVTEELREIADGE